MEYFDNSFWSCYKYFVIIKDLKKDKKISVVTWIIIALIVLYTFADFFKSKIENKSQEKVKVEVIDAINKTHDLIGVEQFPGFTITVLVKIDKRFGYVECGTLKHFTVKLPLSQFVYSYFLFLSQIVKNELALLRRRTVAELPAEPRITYSFCCAYVASFANL